LSSVFLLKTALVEAGSVSRRILISDGLTLHGNNFVDPRNDSILSTDGMLSELRLTKFCRKTPCNQMFDLGCGNRA